MIPNRMLRAEIVDAKQDLNIVELDIPQPPVNGARVRTAFSGVCHSDLHFLEDEEILEDGTVFRNRDLLKSLGQSFSGIVMGHEISGYIEEFGSNVNAKETNLKIGDYVVIFPWVGCNNCTVCLSGNSNMCANNHGGLWDVGQGHPHPGGYSTHIIAHRLDVLLKVPQSIPKELACMLPCSGVTAYSALKIAQTSLEQGILMNGKTQLLVVGAGGLGLWCIQLANILFHDRPIAIRIADVDESKLNNAFQYGADSKVLWKTKYETREEFKVDVQKTGNDGQLQFDAAVDFVGSESTFSLAYKNLRKGGTIVPIGLFGGKVNISLTELIARSISIQATRVASLPLLSEFLEFVGSKEIRYPSVEFFKLQDINLVHQKLRESAVKGRAVLTF